MKCPKCGCEINFHDGGGCQSGCPCVLSETKAMIAAQRHAAALWLLEIRKSIHFWSGELFFQSAVRKSAHVYQMALRDLGIQRKRKSEE